jgi:hypothetical protein
MITTRKVLIEMIRRAIYGDQPPSEANITIGLVNRWLNPGIAVAAKQNNKDNIAIDGISYVNNSFFTKFKDIAIVQDEQNLWRATLPQLPLGLGTSEGISTLELKDSSTGQLSFSVVWLSENQRSFARGMRDIPNRLLAYSQGQYVYIQSPILLSAYTAQVTMISGGDGSDLLSTVNVPDDYIPTLTEYVKQQLLQERSVPKDVANDGSDLMTKTA